MTGARRRLHGVRQVLAFNWPKVLAGAASAVAGLAVARRLPRGSRVVARVGAVAAGWFTAASLAASWWVYDVSPLYEWTWLRRLLPATPVRAHLVVTAGFDEISPAVPALLPGSTGPVVDVLDAAGPMEASIRRARGRHPASAMPVRPDDLPVATGSVEVALVVFAAHELRLAGRREALFRELARVLRPGGRVVLVEHHRDLANVLAFGPGAWHFYPRAEWHRVAGLAGLHVLARHTNTPLVTATAFGHHR